MLAHLCRECGTDLAVVRAAREPHYGLPIVTCPACASVAVRRVHPLARRWRQLRRLDWALTVLAANLVSLGGLLAGTTAFIAWFVEVTSYRAPVEMWKYGGTQMIIGFLLLPLFTGVWLVAGLPHWRPKIAWLTYGGLAFGGLLAVATMTTLVRWQAAVRLGGGTPVDDTWLTEPLDYLVRGTALLVLLLAVAGLGYWPGLGVAALLRTARRVNWRWRRARWRRERG